VLASADSKAKVDIANSIWMCEEFGKQVEKAFLDTNTSFYGAQVRALDFGDPKAADVINEWVKESTKGTIDGIVQPPICGDIVMYLINAVYFNAPWKKAFDPKRTHTGEFALSGGGTVQADFMSVPSGEPKTGYVDGDVCVVRLPYASGRLEMAAVMPKDRSLGDFIAGLNESVLQAYLDKCSETDVLLRFPKFKVEFEIKLNDALKAMGMDKAFSTEADFSGMSKSYGKQLYISEVKHRSCIDVDEQGTEAAAVTSVAIAGCAPVEPMNLKFDKPFLYLIRDTKTGAILFVGAMENPS
jgi:serine protease inhibitor